MRISEDQFNYIINKKLEAGKCMAGTIKDEFLRVFPIDKAENKDKYIKDLILDISHDLKDTVEYIDYMILPELEKLKERLN